MSQKIESKITIIGAGPAGTTLSLFLSKHKIHHTIIDQATFPREKVCGDGFTSEVQRVLKLLDENLYQEFINADWTEPSYGFYTELGNKQDLSFDFKSEKIKSAPFYTAKRKIFDNWMVSKLDPNYANQLFDCKVESIERTGELVLLTCSHNQRFLSITTNLLIGADGERSIVRKTFHRNGIKKYREHHMASIRCYYKDIEHIHPNSPLEFYLLSSKYRGYVWVFYLPNGEANVGICAVSSDVSSQKINLKLELNNFLFSHEVLKNRFKNASLIEATKGWGIPLNSDAYNYTGDNFILLGDSANFCEPATGKGIGIAMYSAYFALPIIIKAIKENNFERKNLAEFELVFNKKYRKEWDKLTYFQRIMTRTNLFTFFFIFISIKPAHNYVKKNLVKTFNRFVHRSNS